MPNWCRNELRVNPSNWACPDVEIEEFLDAIRETIESYKKRVSVWMEQDKKNKKYPDRSQPTARGLFDFNNFIPYPEDLSQRDDDYVALSAEEFKAKYPTNTDKGFAGKYGKDGQPLDGFNNGGYQWCIQNWGTKWGACEPVWVKEHNTLYFNTAWGPAFPIISAIHKRFPRLSLNYEYYERGCAFMGGCEYVPEAWWDVDMIPMGREHEIEMASKKGEDPPEYKWEAGQAYNFWEQKYQGYKGG